MRTPGEAGNTVTRTYLELRSISDLRAAPSPAVDAVVARVPGIPAGTYRALYDLVGAPWHWRDRGRWTDAELTTYLASPGVHVYELRVEGETAGYFELRLEPPDIVEIMYFGLARAYMGRGLGGWLLTEAVHACAALGATRVTLNTCTLDAPAALPNYIARGFRIVREEQHETT